MTATVDAPPAPLLADLAATANEEYRLCEQTAATPLQHAINAGEALLQAKEQVPPGKWGAWIAENFQGSRATARNYMRWAARKDELLSNGVPSMRAATDFLCGDEVLERGWSVYEGEPREHAIRLVETGLPKARVAEQLGVTKQTLSRWTNPDYDRQQRARQDRTRKRAQAARKALREQERARAIKTAARKKGGAIAEAYADAERTQDILGRAREQFDSRWDKEMLAEAVALHNKYRDKIVQLLGVAK